MEDELDLLRQAVQVPCSNCGEVLQLIVATNQPVSSAICPICHGKFDMPNDLVSEIRALIAEAGSFIDNVRRTIAPARVAGVLVMTSARAKYGAEFEIIRNTLVTLGLDRFLGLRVDGTFIPNLQEFPVFYNLPRKWTLQEFQTIARNRASNYDRRWRDESGFDLIGCRAPVFGAPGFIGFLVRK